MNLIRELVCSTLLHNFRKRYGRINPNDLDSPFTENENAIIYLIYSARGVGMTELKKTPPGTLYWECLHSFRYWVFENFPEDVQSSTFHVIGIRVKPIFPFTELAEFLISSGTWLVFREYLRSLHNYTGTKGASATPNAFHTSRPLKTSI